MLVYGWLICRYGHGSGMWNFSTKKIFPFFPHFFFPIFFPPFFLTSSQLNFFLLSFLQQKNFTRWCSLLWSSTFGWFLWLSRKLRATTTRHDCCELQWHEKVGYHFCFFHIFLSYIKFWRFFFFFFLIPPNNQKWKLPKDTPSAAHLNLFYVANVPLQRRKHACQNV